MTAHLPPQAPRCWVEEELSARTIALSAAEQRHLQKVRRVRAGDPVCVLNGRGALGTGRLGQDGYVEVTQVETLPPPRPEISLYMGALKQSAWEEVLRHATELGVSRIVRVETAHAVSRLEGKSEKKSARWYELLVEACKQSANPWLPELSLMSSVSQAVQDAGLSPDGWVACLREGATPLSEALMEKLPGSMAVWIGPEGDFTDAEVEQILGTGAVPVSLGPRVLRAETAALSLLSCLRLNG